MTYYIQVVEYSVFHYTINDISMIYQPRRSDNYRGQRPRWLSLLGL